ncbi:zinc ribbon domain-containing protein [Dictyobacter aurantiacus]|nr:zinc ribbon domain-containing protein [Dictyobacter aurantiacus]
MFCTRCGKEIAETTRICPACGSSTGNEQPHTSYGAYPPLENGSPASRQRPNIVSPVQEPAPHGPGQNSYRPPHTNGYAASPPPYQQPPMYQASFTAYAASADGASAFTITQRDNTALITEFILSLIGIFGVGWLMTRETTVGSILLVCSFFLYWPLMILGTLFTFGFGLICLGPLAIGAIILNVVLLNSTIKRQATHFIITPQPPQRMTVPPQRY